MNVTSLTSVQFDSIYFDWIFWSDWTEIGPVSVPYKPILNEYFIKGINCTGIRSTELGLSHRLFLYAGSEDFIK